MRLRAPPRDTAQHGGDEDRHCCGQLGGALSRNFHEQSQNVIMNISDSLSTTSGVQECVKAIDFAVKHFHKGSFNRHVKRHLDIYSIRQRVLSLHYCVQTSPSTAK